MIESTLVIIKPDAFEKRVVGKVISALEENELAIAAMDMLGLEKEDAEEFYIEHEGKDFFDRLTTFMSTGPLIVMVVVGEGAIARVREIIGSTAAAGTKEDSIRGKYGTPGITHENVVHASDSIESATRELDFFFRTSEVM